MASQLTRDDVAHIASLARLDLSAAELDTFARQLADILAYAAVVQQVDTTGAGHPDAATAGPPLRPDQPAPGLDRDSALSGAPDAAREAGLFRVPKVL